MTSDWSLEVLGVSKRFGEVRALDGVSLQVRRGEFFSLLGPSGCGKTTLLRLIGGFERPTAGTIRIHGREMTDEPPYRRPVNTVFQHCALFPHLTARENVAFGLRRRGVPRAQAARLAADALALVRLSGCDDAYPHRLSGGQKQRVALARALAVEPEVLLLDEPMAALDPGLRREVQAELKSLQRRVGITFLFVTHDQQEALALSDRVAVMSHGRVEQTDTAVRVFESPATEFVARFMGASNLLRASVEERGDRFIVVALAAGTRLRLDLDGAAPPLRAEVCLVVRPEKLNLAAEDSSDRGLASMPVTVEDRLYQGASTLWSARDAAGERLVVYEQNDRPFADEQRFAVGSRAFLVWDPRYTVLLPLNGCGGDG